MFVKVLSDKDFDKKFSIEILLEYQELILWWLKINYLYAID